MDETGTGPDGANPTDAPDQLADARARVEGLEREVADATAEAATLREQLDRAHERLRTTAARYRDLVVRSEPALPPELIAGDDIDAIDATAEAARKTVARLRAQLEDEAQQRRVPAGAPPRSRPDLSGLSPEQKIRVGLAQRRD
jgi:hypothetical protein